MDRFHDEFEVVSIGALYQGEWQRRYWNKFRAKKKYPFPVGYRAKRVYDGRRYTMEICEGLRGPQFKVTSEDGSASLGETATAAWQRALSGRQKRLSSNIDGLELFGFKHQIVQQLLQDLPVGEPMLDGRHDNEMLDHPSRDEEAMVAYDSDVEEVGNRQDVAGRLLSRTWSYASSGGPVHTSMENLIQVQRPKEHNRRQKLHLPPRKRQRTGAGLCGGDEIAGTAFECMENLDGEPGNFEVQELDPSCHWQCSLPNSRAGDTRQLDDQPVEQTGATDVEETNNPARKLLSGKRYFGSSAVEYLSSQGDVYLRSRSRPVPVKRMTFEVAPNRKNRLGVATILQVDEDVDLDIDTESEDVEEPFATDNFGRNSESQLSRSEQVSSDVDGILFPEESPAINRSPVKVLRTPAVQTLFDVHPGSQGERNVTDIAHSSPRLTCSAASDQQDPHPFSPQEDNELDGLRQKQYEELKAAKEKQLPEITVCGHQTADEEHCMESYDRTGDPTSLPSDSKGCSALKNENLKTESGSEVGQDWWNTDSPSGFLYSSQELQEVIAGCQKADRSTVHVLPNLEHLSDGQSLRECFEELAVTVAVALPTVQEEKLHCRDTPAMYPPMENKGYCTSQDLTANFASSSMPQVDESDMLTGKIPEPALSTGACDPLVLYKEGFCPTPDEALQRNNNLYEGKPTETGTGRSQDLVPIYGNQCDWDYRAESRACDSTTGYKGDVQKVQLETGGGHESCNVEHGNMCQPSKALDRTEILAAPENVLESSAPTCIALISHPSPVRSMWITALGDIIQLCVLCSSDPGKGRTLFIYRTQKGENDDFEFLLWTTFIIYLRCGVNGTYDENEQGIVFLPGGEGLIMLDYFCLPEQWEGSNGAADQGDNGLQILGFNSQVVWLHSKLSCATEMHYISVPQSQLIVAAAANGQLICWEMDVHWKFYQERFLLPKASDQAGRSTVSQLMTLPGSPHLIIGCYSVGIFAIWDHRRRVLLRSFQGLQPDFSLVKAQMLVLVPSATAGASWQVPEVTFQAENETPETDSGLYCRKMNICFLVQTRYAVLKGDEVHFSSPLNDSVCAARGAGSSAVFGTSDGQTFLVETLSGKRVASYLELEGSCINSVVVEPEAQVFATGTQSGVVAVYVKLQQHGPTHLLGDGHTLEVRESWLQS